MGINPDLLGEKCVQCDILEKRSTGKIRRDISKAVAFHNSPESLTDLRHEHNHPLQGICHKSVSDSYLLQDKMSSKPTHPNHHPLLSVLSRAQVHIDETDTEKQETIYMTATETFETLQQEHLKIFLEDVMENRAQLLSLHNENTGLFKDVVFTDDIDYALLRLKALLKYTVENHIASRTVFNIEEDPKFQKMIDHKLKKLALLQNIYSKNF